MTLAESELLSQLIDVKRSFAGRGWMLATSGNLSARISSVPLRFWISVSGRDKEQTDSDDFMIVDGRGEPEGPSAHKPSAEAEIHAAVYKKVGSGAVFHVHSVYNAITSEQAFADRGIVFEGLEILKGLGCWEPRPSLRIPIVENLHDLHELADLVSRSIDPSVPGLLIESHGLYAWGNSCFETKRHVEAFEFLFQWNVVKRMMRS